MDTLEKIQGPCQAEPRGTLLIRPGLSSAVILGNKPYSSDYWQAMPDGDYLIHITQGGVRNREIPRAEKDKIKSYLRWHWDEGGLSTAQFTNLNGEIVQIRIEQKQ